MPLLLLLRRRRRRQQQQHLLECLSTAAAETGIHLSFKNIAHHPIARYVHCDAKRHESNLLARHRPASCRLQSLQSTSVGPPVTVLRMFCSAVAGTRDVRVALSPEFCVLSGI